MRPGTLVWVDFDPARGHEQKKHRPALVVSERAFRSLIIVVPLTSTPPRIRAHHRMAGERMSVALCEQIRAIDRERITKTIGLANPSDVIAVRTTLAHLLGIRPHPMDPASDHKARVQAAFEMVRVRDAALLEALARDDGREEGQ